MGYTSLTIVLFVVDTTIILSCFLGIFIYSQKELNTIIHQDFLFLKQSK